MESWVLKYSLIYSLIWWKKILLKGIKINWMVNVKPYNKSARVYKQYPLQILMDPTFEDLYL